MNCTSSGFENLLQSNRIAIQSRAIEWYWMRGSNHSGWWQQCVAVILSLQTNIYMMTMTRKTQHMSRGTFKMVTVMVTVVMARVTVVVLVLFAGPDDISFFKQILFAIYSIFETPHFTRNYICGLPNPIGFLPRNRAIWRIWSPNFETHS